MNLHRDFGLALGENGLRDFDGSLLRAFPDDLSELILESDVKKSVSFEDTFRVFHGELLTGLFSHFLSH
ncbi:MAG: hypothetical protein M3444_00445 [Acidobacteriota bacterium]|nr:hypothetical protein [Acidobacteriota bacterium]